MSFDASVTSMIDWPVGQSYVNLLPMLQTDKLFEAMKSSKISPLAFEFSLIQSWE